MSAKDREKSAAGRGFHVFSKVAQCTLCHLPPVLSDTLFHNVGMGLDTEKPDLGRGKILADAAAKANTPAPPEAQTTQGAFKTPSLRGVALSWPYFHDGGVKTLEEAVDLMIKGGIPNPHLDEKLKPAKLSAKQRADMLAFLKAHHARKTSPTRGRPCPRSSGHGQGGVTFRTRSRTSHEGYAVQFPCNVSSSGGGLSVGPALPPVLRTRTISPISMPLSAAFTMS